MSQQGPVLIVSGGANPALAEAIGQLKVFPVVETGWDDASDALARLQPAAIIAGDSELDEPALQSLANAAVRIQPYTPLIALDPKIAPPVNVIPFTQPGRQPKHLVMRLNAALRVRSMHATLMRRMSDPSGPKLPQSDPLHDATTLLIGRGGSYPALSVTLGSRTGVVGALSIEAAAKHLNARDLDGIVVGEGFSGRVMDAFLMVLSENPRFRNLPVVLAGATGMTGDYDLPNLEITHGEPDAVAASALPLIRQHAFQSRLQRALKSIDAGGLLDPHSGLLTREAFEHDLAGSIGDAHMRGGGLSVVRIWFAAASERTQFDAARILGRLMRRMDFATLDGTDGVLVVFTGADLRTAHMIARRLTSVLKHTMMDTKGESRVEPHVSISTMMPDDTTQSMLARLNDDKQQRAAS